MTDLERAIEAAVNAPEGPGVGAFFDLDGTLVKGFTAFAFVQEQLRSLGADRLLELAKDLRHLHDDEERDRKTIERAAQLLADRPVEELEKAAAKVFNKHVSTMMRPGARDLVRAHLHREHTVVLATAATRIQAAPVADDLDIPHLVCTEVEVADGRLTGRLDGPPRWGDEKARAVASFSAEYGIDLAQSFGYANGHEDRPLLEAVGRPAAVCPDASLTTFAELTGTPLYRLDDPAHTDVRSVLGTVAALGTFNAGMLAAVAGKLISGGRWKTIGTTLTATADMCLWVAGIDLHVQGRHHLEAARPAVFVLNHQSNLDAAIVGALIRHDFTGVAKQEAANDPRGFAFRWLDVALIDRSNHEAARKSVAALAQRIRGGESVVIFPEGTRMPTQHLGEFKKGAFFLAMDAGVPVVPIVLRNTGELWPRGTNILHPGTADVCVLPPVSTEGWTPDTIADRVTEIRAMFERTLDDWPKGD